MESTRSLRVGLFGIGLEAYWPQFEGLKPRLVCLGLFVLVASTIIVGYGNYLGGSSGGH